MLPRKKRPWPLPIEAAISEFIISATAMAFIGSQSKDSHLPTVFLTQHISDDVILLPVTDTKNEEESFCLTVMKILEFECVCSRRDRDCDSLFQHHGAKWNQPWLKTVLLSDVAYGLSISIGLFVVFIPL